MSFLVVLDDLWSRDLALKYIAVLEDDQRRITAISKAVRTQFADHELRIFDSAPEMIGWLTEHRDNIQLISLDCDLDATALVNAECGSGEDVAAHLGNNPPHCPVLIHSSNAMRAPAMHLELTTAGWPNVELCPFRDEITWVADVRAALARMAGTDGQ